MAQQYYGYYDEQQIALRQRRNGGYSYGLDADDQMRARPQVTGYNHPRRSYFSINPNTSPNTTPPLTKLVAPGGGGTFTRMAERDPTRNYHRGVGDRVFDDQRRSPWKTTEEDFATKLQDEARKATIATQLLGASAGVGGGADHLGKLQYGDQDVICQDGVCYYNPTRKSDQRRHDMNNIVSSPTITNGGVKWTNRGLPWVDRNLDDHPRDRERVKELVHRVGNYRRSPNQLNYRQEYYGGGNYGSDIARQGKEDGSGGGYNRLSSKPQAQFYGGNTNYGTYRNQRSHNDGVGVADDDGYYRSYDMIPSPNKPSTMMVRPGNRSTFDALSNKEAADKYNGSFVLK